MRYTSNCIMQKFQGTWRGVKSSPPQLWSVCVFARVRLFYPNMLQEKLYFLILYWYVQTDREKKGDEGFEKCLYPCVCVSRCVFVYVCQHEYFRGPTLSGGDRASPERGHTGLQGGDWEDWTERKREKEKERQKRQRERNETEKNQQEKQDDSTHTKKKKIT